jgi:hypothetical protein
MRLSALLVIHQPRWFSFFWGLVKWAFRKKLRDRLRLLGTDLAALHRLVPASALPAHFGGTLQQEPFFWLDQLQAREAAGELIGGFALPLRTDDPTGSKRRAAAAAGEHLAPIALAEGAPLNWEGSLPSPAEEQAAEAQQAAAAAAAAAGSRQSSGGGGDPSGAPAQ